MPTFQKIETVEARKYEGPKLTVVSDALGEQTAVSGDYLLGTERGKITVMSAAKFEAEYKPYSPSPDAEALAAEIEKHAATQSLLDVSLKTGTDLQAEVDAIKAKLAELEPHAEETAALKTQVIELQGKLQSAEAQKSLDEAELADLKAKLQEFASANAKADAAQAAIEKALNS